MFSYKIYPTLSHFTTSVQYKNWTIYHCSSTRDYSYYVPVLLFIIIYHYSLLILLIIHLVVLIELRMLLADADYCKIVIIEDGYVAGKTCHHGGLAIICLHASVEV